MKQPVNYIHHHKEANNRLCNDDVSPFDISVYNALFLLWNASGWQDELSINRGEVMSLAKVGNARTYTACLKTLHEKGYLTYFPSFNPLIGSVVCMSRFDRGAIGESAKGSNGNTAKGTIGNSAYGSAKATAKGGATLPKHTNVVTNKLNNEGCATASTSEGDKISKEVRMDPTKKEKSSAQKENSLLPVAAWEGNDCPFSDATQSTWVLLCGTPKWRKKELAALATSLKKLMKYEELFAVELMEYAISGGYQGVVYPDTDVKYEQWKKNKNQSHGAHKQSIGESIIPEGRRDYGKP